MFLLQAESVVSTALSLSALPEKGASSSSCPVQLNVAGDPAWSTGGAPGGFGAGSHQGVSRISDTLVIILIAERGCSQVSQLKSQLSLWSLSFLMKTLP